MIAHATPSPKVNYCCYNQHGWPSCLLVPARLDGARHSSATESWLQTVAELIDTLTDIDFYTHSLLVRAWERLTTGSSFNHTWVTTLAVRVFELHFNQGYCTMVHIITMFNFISWHFNTQKITAAVWWQLWE